MDELYHAGCICQGLTSCFFQDSDSHYQESQNKAIEAAMDGGFAASILIFENLIFEIPKRGKNLGAG